MKLPLLPYYRRLRSPSPSLHLVTLSLKLRFLEFLGAEAPLPCLFTLLSFFFLQQVEMGITIIVEDRNNNKPIFQNEPYFTDVPEVPLAT